MFCHEADCSKLITFKSQFVTPDRSFTTCKSCCEKLDIINNTDKYENLVDKLRHDYHEWNKDAEDIYVDIYVEVVSYPRILSKDEYYYVTYNLVWKDEEDVEHKQECGSYSSVEDVIFEIKDTFKHSCYLYVFNIHYETLNHTLYLSNDNKWSLISCSSHLYYYSSILLISQRFIKWTSVQL